MITVIIVITTDETGIHMLSNARGFPESEEETKIADELKRLLSSPTEMFGLGKPDRVTLIERDQISAPQKAKTDDSTESNQEES